MSRCLKYAFVLVGFIMIVVSLYYYTGISIEQKYLSEMISRVEAVAEVNREYGRSIGYADDEMWHLDMDYLDSLPYEKKINYLEASFNTEMSCFIRDFISEIKKGNAKGVSVNDWVKITDNMYELK